MSKLGRQKLSQEEWLTVSDYYQKALSLSGKKRSDFLTLLESENPGMHRKVKRFLDNQTDFDEFLDSDFNEALLAKVRLVDSAQFLTEGSVIDQFKIVRRLGIGGLATVYLAHDNSLDREIALKVSNTAFRHEGKILAKLEHPHIVRVYSQSQTNDGLFYISMQYVPGETLARLLSLPPKIGVDPFEFLLNAGAELSQALEHAHARNVLHLDIKPENIIINSSGQAMLMDFNVSVRAHDGSEGLKSFGGTPPYMSPEQRGVFETMERGRALQKVDERSDVFGLGITLKELALKWQLKLPRNITQLLDKAAHEKYDERIQSAKDFHQGLQDALDMLRIERRLSVSWLSSGWVKRHPSWTATLLQLSVNLVASLTSVQYFERRTTSVLTASAWREIASASFIGVSAGTLVAAVLWIVTLGKMRIAAGCASRSETLKLPGMAALTPFTLWGCAAVTMPFLLARMGARLPSNVTREICASLLFNGIGIMGITYLGHLLLLSVNLYPHTLKQVADVSRTIKADVARFRSRFFVCLTSLIVLPWMKVGVSRGFNALSNPNAAMTHSEVISAVVPIILLVWMALYFVIHLARVNALYSKVK